MIQCQSCKTENPPDRALCHKCGADLLPGISSARRAVMIGSSILLTLLLLIPVAIILSRSGSGGTSEGSGCILGLLLGLGVFCAVALFVSFRKTPEAMRYAMRARRHAAIDPAQAFADYTRAVERTPSSVILWKERGALYDKLELETDALQQEIALLGRALQRSGGELQGELGWQVVRNYEKLIHAFEAEGKNQEAVRQQLGLLDFIDRNVKSLHQFQTDAVGFGTGVTLQVRRELRRQVRESREHLHRAGLVSAIGYCPICRQWVRAGPDLECPNYTSHKHLTDLRFVTLDGADEEIAELQGTGQGA